MKIKKAALKDIKLLVKMHRESQDPLDKILGTTNGDIKKEFYDLMKNKKAEYFLCEDKGLICFKPDFPGYRNCEVYWLVVSKKYQRKGIGTILLKFIEKYAKKKKFRAIYLYTHPIRENNAIKLYKKEGYKKINEFPNYYSNGDKSLLFGKRLK